MNPFSVVRDAAFPAVPSNELHAAIYAALTEAAAGYSSGWSSPMNKYAYVVDHFVSRLGTGNPFVSTIRTLWASKV